MGPVDKNAQTQHDQASQNQANLRKIQRRPLYQQTADVLEKMLETMEPGTFLPSEPQLARQLGVSRATLREAIRTFEERGQIVRRQGIGTYVSRVPQVIDTGLEVLESVPTLATRIDLEIEMVGLEVQERMPTEIESDLFNIEESAPVVEVSRVLVAGDRPVTYLIDIIPQGIVPVEAFGDEFHGSVLDIILQRGEHDLGHSRTEITAISAPAEIARRLQISRNKVLLVLEAWLCTADGVAIDHSLSYFLPGVFRFHVVRRVGR